MCGILGVVRPNPVPVDLSDEKIVCMRDRMAYRGPDSAGLWRSEKRHVVLAHRRLRVIDLSEQAAQPMVSLRQDKVLVYNGELYNDAELRTELAEHGRRVEGASDSHTVAAALEQWGAGAFAKLRGMYAIAWFDEGEQTLTLARDPLGIKPLYYWLRRDDAGDELVFASSPAAIVQHPRCNARPDLQAISAYLSTIRLTLGSRTLFSEIKSVLPGEVLRVELGKMTGSTNLRIFSTRFSPQEEMRAGLSHEKDWAANEASSRLREVIADSIDRHLRADVPWCVLLSGGLDSSIIAQHVVSRAKSSKEIRTYCSGYDDGSGGGDPAYAQRVAQHIGTTHASIPITRELFASRWPEMIDRQGLPLSTPNEVAINHVARHLRADGCVVALSGEGADELFAGYEMPMRMAYEFERVRRNTDHESQIHPGHFQIFSAAWLAPDQKAGVIQPKYWNAVEHDAALLETYAAEFDDIRVRCSAEADPLEAHLRFHQRVNLVGLLTRLDSATMLEGVEGRTPLADVRVAAMANALPMSLKFEYSSEPGRSMTKGILRRAYGVERSDGLPKFVIERPKASFPIPFAEWMEDVSPIVRSSELIRELFFPEAIEAVAKNPQRVWSLAWPMTNLAIWARKWWG